MKTLVSRILSTVLMAAMISLPALAQHSRKDAGHRNNKIATAVSDLPSKTSGKRSVLTPQPMRVPTRGLRKPVTSVASPTAKTAMTPLHARTDMPTIYGSVIFNDQTDAGLAEVGLYDLPTSSTAEGELIIPGAKSSGGGVYVDGIYYSTSYMSLFGITMVTITAYNVETGEQLFSHSSLNMEALFVGMVYDSGTDTIYGIGYNADGTSYQLSKVAYDESSVTVTAVGLLDGRWNTLMIDGAGQLWGISYVLENVNGNSLVTSSALCKINKNDASVTVVGDTGLRPEYRSSGAIDTRSGRMFWNVCPADGSGWMCEVDMNTGRASYLYQFRYNDEITGMYIPDAGILDSAPAECKDVSINFPSGEFNGTMTLTTPSQLYNGNPGSGSLTVSVYANSELVTEVPAQWGSNMTINLDMTPFGPGLYDFAVCATNAAGAGPNTKLKGVYIGADTPAATTATLEYTNGEMRVTWLPVTSSVNGGYMDLDNLSYTVKDMKGNVLASGLKQTSFSESIAIPDNITCYRYSVETVCSGLVSEPALTNIISLGDIIPPYTSDFATNELAGWTVIDANGDERTWFVEDGVAKAPYSETLKMDDWLITPPIKLNADKSYWLTFAAWSSTVYGERMEIKIGKSPNVNAMTSVLLEPTDVIVDEEEPMQIDRKIDVDDDGLYYIGFHGISDKDKFFLYLSNISISAGLANAAPGMPGNLRISPDRNGLTKATVSFVTPRVTVEDKPLSSLDKIEIARDGEVIKTFTNPAVNTEMSFVDEVGHNGEYTYSVTAYNGAGKGLTASATAFVGCDAPVPPTKVTLKRTATTGEVTAEWPAVTYDINGISYPEGAVTYTIAKDVDGSWETIADNISATSYTFQAVEDDTQKFVQCAVFAKSDMGTSEGKPSNMIPAGKPYQGLDETFSPSGLKYIWGISTVGDMTVSINGTGDIEGIDGVNGDGGYVIYEATDINASAMLYSGLISTKGIENPGLTFYVYNIVDDKGMADINYVNLKYQTNDIPEWQTLSSITMNEAGGNVPGWHKVTVPLSRIGADTFQIGIEAVCKHWVYTLVDNIAVTSVNPVDLRAAGISAPSKVKAGAEFTVDVTVTNDGTEDASNYAVQLYENGSLVETADLSRLASGDKTTIPFERTMSAIATEPVEYYAQVVYAADAVADNNRTTTISVEPIISHLPTPGNAQASSYQGAVKLTWKRPDLGGNDGQPVTFDFEDADPYASEYGDWIFYDGDKSPVGGVQGTEIPNIYPGQTTGSFWIWDSDVVPGNETFHAHSGTKYLFSLFRYDAGKADDWAISPELSGDAQKIVFYAKSYDPSYPETLAVYYSTGSTDVADFTEVSNSRVKQVPSDWTRYEIQLPAGAKRFAIRSEATDAFMLMIDDVTFIPASTSDMVITGYNVYRDGLKINPEPVTATEYIDANVVDGERYTYVVTAIYEGEGESAASNVAEVIFDIDGIAGIGNDKVTVTVTDGCIIVREATGSNVAVASVNGTVIYNAPGATENRIAAVPGVYVVTIGRKALKVVVK